MPKKSGVLPRKSGGLLALNQCYRYTGGQKCMYFRTKQPSPRKKITPTPGRPKSNVVPATQNTSTRQRKNADKAPEALHYLV